MVTADLDREFTETAPGQLAEMITTSGERGLRRG
jgi:hypothetical protein